MVKSKLFLLMATLILVALLVGACTRQPSPSLTPTPTPPPGPTQATELTEIEVSNAADARDAALAYLRENESEQAPSADIVWQERNITPRGVAGVGGETIEFTSGEWTITVSYPVPPPEDIIYDVAVINAKLDWHWSGTVKADSSMIEFDPFKQPGREKSRVMSEEFLRESPTFATSGIEDTLRLAEAIIPLEPCAFCWTFIYEFDSRHAGYGDTSGQVVAEVITPHRAVIAIEQFKVKSAVMDDKWDMIKQEMIGD
jgi:hypothetical protein